MTPRISIPLHPLNGLPVLLCTVVLWLAACSGPDAEVETLYRLSDEAKWSPQSGRVETQAGALILPAGEAISFYLRLPVGSRLEIDTLSSRSASSDRTKATLEVALLVAGDDSPSPLATLTAGTSRQRIPLRPVQATTRGPGAAKPGDIARLILTARAAGDGESRGSQTVTVGDPVIRVPGVRQPRSLASATMPASDPKPVADALPNVVLVVVDTLRTDHLGMFGYDRPVSPVLDRLADESFVFEDAVAQSSWTRPSVSTILTGLEPHLHQLDYFGGYLPAANLTLAEILSDAGYATRATLANGILAGQAGFDQGFDEFEMRPDDRQLVDEAIHMAEELAEEQPFFLYVHAMDPHIPYSPPEETRRVFAADSTIGPQVYADEVKVWHLDGMKRGDPRIAELLDLYDAEIANTDQQLGRLLDRLRQLDLYDSALILFTVDHGEAFWDRGKWGHGKNLYNELVDIPLVVKPPGANGEGHRLPDLVSQVDVFRTVADYVGIEPPDFVRGRSLRPLLERRADSVAADHSVYSALDNRDSVGVAVTTKEWKLLVPRSESIALSPGLKLFDRLADPDERRDLSSQRPVVLEYMLTLLRKHEAASYGWIRPSTGSLSEEERAELVALGYLSR